MHAIGAALASRIRPGDVIGLSGGLGAGKTTLARGLLSALGLAEEAPSPSFAIVQPYDPPLVRMAVAHVDLYRLENADDVEELGLDEYLEYGALLIEWPDRMGERIWPDALLLDIAVEPDGARRLTVTVPFAWRDRWPL
jgi:tRNA threonylcarbamoyladenosine biosynthesis protein TsaE